MGSLTIMQKGTPCDETIDWPLFYMNDFSVLGLLVDSLARTLDALEAQGYRVVRKEGIAKVRFENSARYRDIFKALERQNIEHGMSDLVSCAYQG